MADDELSRRRDRNKVNADAEVQRIDATQYATPMGKDIIAGVLPHTIHVGGVTYKATTGITAEDITALVEWCEEIAEGLQWGVIYLGDGDGPELHPIWSLTSVWLASGVVRAALAGVTGGPVPSPAPILMRADAPSGAAEMLVHAHDEALNALSRAADFL